MVLSAPKAATVVIANARNALVRNIRILEISYLDLLNCAA
jgi:hypothetical protein